MKNWPTAKSISETPISGVFVAPDKYLRLQHFSITEPMPPISEDESIVFFVTSGEGRITINGVEFPLSTGSLCWLQSYHTYTIEPTFGSTLEFALCVYDYPLSSYLVMRPMTNPVSRAIMQAMPVINIREDKVDIILRLLGEFEAENDNYSRGSSTIKVAVLGQIVFFFINDCVKRAKRHDPASVMPLGWHATLYIAEHYREQLTSEGVAAEFGCTAAEMNRALMLQVEKNFEEFLNYVRINRAAELLLTTDQTVTYIAMEVGYANVKTFNRNFLRFKVMTPGDFRKKVALQESRL